MNRRYFIGTAVAAGLTAAKKTAAANEKVNVGLIGVGRRGRGLMQDFAALPDVNIAYLCDVDHFAALPDVNIAYLCDVDQASLEGHGHPRRRGHQAAADDRRHAPHL